MASLKDKVPPHNLDAEQAALGALLLDWDAVENAIRFLRPERFYSLQNLAPKHADSERSFVDLFKRCGFPTVWLGNQEPAKTYVYFMEECDRLVYGEYQ